MLKRLCLFGMLVLMGLAIPSLAVTYSYSGTGPLNLTDGDWTLEWGENWSDVVFEATLLDKELKFENTFGGESNANRGAYVWTAPEGEVITHVEFYWNRQGYRSEFDAAMFDMSGVENLVDADILWSTGGAYTAGADGSLFYDIDGEDNVFTVGLGFVDTYSTLYHSAMFNCILINTSPQVMSPVFDPADGEITGPTAVTITCPTAGASIYYTVDGTTPTAAAGLPYTSAVTVGHGTTLKAIAVADGYFASRVTSQQYISAATVYDYSTSGTLVMTDGSWTLEKSGNYFDIIYAGTLLDNQIQIENVFGGESHVNRGAYVWTAPEGEVITHVGCYWNRQGYRSEFNAALFSIAKDGSLEDADILWSTESMYTGGADGFISYDADGLDNISSIGLGFEDSFSTLDHSVMYNWIVIETEPSQLTEDPVFSPDPCGNYISGPTDITITCETSGAEIHYTLNGDTPTMSSALYAGPVTVDDGVTLKAIAGKAGLANSSVTSMSYAVPSSYNRPLTIAFGDATVDGDLSDWADADWAPLDQQLEINSTPSALSADVPEAYYAARWQADKVYVAVKVRDTSHYLTDWYGTWWAGHDSIEVFIHTDNDGDADYSPYNQLAQQYEVGIKDTDNSAVWTMVGANGAGELTGTSGVVESAGSVSGEWLYYEMALTPFKYFGLLKTGDLSDSIESVLFEGEVIGLDVEVISNENYNYLGKLAENMMTGRYCNWTNIGLHVLEVEAAPLAGDANLDGAVDVGDLGILAANYGGTDKTWAQGDFNDDGAVDVGDLGILAANYGQGSSSAADFDADYAKVFGSDADAEEDTDGSLCSVLGLPLIAGLLLVGLMLVKLED